MKMSRREGVLFFVTLTIAVFAFTLLAARPKFIEWKVLFNEQKNLELTLQRYKKLVAERAQWDKEYAKVSKSLPKFPADQKMDVHWRAIMTAFASKNNVQILKMGKGVKEEQVGELYELPIECVSWEASLDAITHFLFDLQFSDAMLDVRELRISSKGSDSALGGRFRLYCAYSREQP